MTGGALGASLGKQIGDNSFDSETGRRISTIAGGLLGALGGGYAGYRLAPAFGLEESMGAGPRTGTYTDVMKRTGLVGGLSGATTGSMAGGLPGALAGGALGVPLGIGMGALSRYVADRSYGATPESRRQVVPGEFFGTAPKLSYYGEGNPYLDKIAGNLAKTVNPLRDNWKKAYSLLRKNNHSTSTLPIRKIAAELNLPTRDVYDKLRYIQWNNANMGIPVRQLTSVNTYGGKLHPIETMLDSIRNRVMLDGKLHNHSSIFIGKPLNEVPKEALWLASMARRKDALLRKTLAKVNSLESKIGWDSRRNKIDLQIAEASRLSRAATTRRLLSDAAKTNNILKGTTALGAIGTGAGVVNAALPEQAPWYTPQGIQDRLSGNRNYNPYLDKRSSAFPVFSTLVGAGLGGLTGAGIGMHMSPGTFTTPRERYRNAVLGGVLGAGLGGVGGYYAAPYGRMEDALVAPAMVGTPADAIARGVLTGGVSGGLTSGLQRYAGEAWRG